MRRTAVYLLEAAVIAGVGLAAFTAMRAADRLIGHDSPFMPTTISAIFVGLWIFLLRRYVRRRHHPVDLRRQKLWLLSSTAASGALAVLGLITAAWIGGTYSDPGISCRARSSTNPILPSDDPNIKGLATTTAMPACVTPVSSHAGR